MDHLLSIFLLLRQWKNLESVGIGFISFASSIGEHEMKSIAVGLSALSKTSG